MPISMRAGSRTYDFSGGIRYESSVYSARSIAMFGSNLSLIVVEFCHTMCDMVLAQVIQQMSANQSLISRPFIDVDTKRRTSEVPWAIHTLRSVLVGSSRSGCDCGGGMTTSEVDWLFTEAWPEGLSPIGASSLTGITASDISAQSNSGLLRCRPRTQAVYRSLRGPTQIFKWCDRLPLT